MASTQTPSSSQLVFVDSSVVIAAAVSSRGRARELMQLGAVGWIELAVSDLVIAKARRNLEKKAPHAIAVFDEFIEFGRLTLSKPTSALIVDVAKVVAGKDAPIIAGAITAGARLIASYDRKHLLSRAPEIWEALQVQVSTPDSILAVLSLAGE